MFDDIPVDCQIERHDDGINIRHLRSHEPDQGHAKEAIARVAQLAREEGKSYVVINIGNGGRKDSAEFLRRLGFEVLEEHSDHVTAELELNDEIEWLD